MKKIILVVFAAFMTTGLFAQDMEFGLKAGVNVSFLVGEEDVKGKPGFYGGAFVEFLMGPMWGIQPELVYSRQGADYTAVGGKDATYRLNYLNLPVIFKLYVIERKLSIDVGPQFGFMFTPKDKVGSTIFDLDDVLEAAGADKTNKFDVGAAIGATYNFGIVEASLRYNMGFINPIPDSDGLNGVLQIGAGLRF